MAKKNTPRKNTKAPETLELDDTQAAQVKGGVFHQITWDVKSPTVPVPGITAKKS